MIAAILARNGDLPVLLFAIGFPIVFVGRWVLITFVLSHIGGWSTFAQYYRDQPPFSGTIIRFQSAQFRAGTNYNGCLKVGANSEGLHLVAMAIFRAFHPPLLIAWTGIVARPVKVWGIFDLVELGFQRTPNLPVRTFPFASSLRSRPSSPGLRSVASASCPILLLQSDDCGKSAHSHALYCAKNS